MSFTISDTSPRSQYTASAAQTVFTVPWEWRDDTDVAVRVNDAVKTLNTDYTLTGAGVSGGGACTFASAMAGSEIITIYRDMPIARTTDQYSSGGQLPASVLEATFDDLTMRMQQLERDIARAIHMAPGDSSDVGAFELASVAARKGKYGYFFNAVTGQPEFFTSIGNTVLTQSVIGGYLWPQTAAELSAGVTPTRYYIEPYNVLRYGAVADGVTDDSGPIQQAIDSLEAANKGGIVFFPSGTYKIVTGATVEKNGITLEGCGDGGDAVSNDQGTTLKYSGNVAGVTGGVSGGGRWNIRLKNLRIDISGAGAAAVGLLWYAVRHPGCDNVRIVTSEGSAAATGQTGMKADGQGAFCAWGTFNNLYVKGDFTKGIHMRGNASATGMNSCVFNGGGVYSTRSAIHVGSFGVHIEQGNSNVVTGFDCRGFETNLQCDADADRNSFIMRHEAGSSTNYAVFAVGSSFNDYLSHSHGLSGFTDNGTSNTAILQDGPIAKQADVASATNISWVSTLAVWRITGATTINTITAPTTGSATVRLLFVSNPTVNDDSTAAGNIRLAGGANFASTADDVLTLVWNATDSKWHEVGRSVN